MPGEIPIGIPGQVGGRELDQQVLPSDLFEIDPTTKTIRLRDGWTFASPNQDAIEVILTDLGLI